MLLLVVLQVRGLDERIAAVSDVAHVRTLVCIRRAAARARSRNGCRLAVHHGTSGTALRNRVVVQSTEFVFRVLQAVSALVPLGILPGAHTALQLDERSVIPIKHLAKAVRSAVFLVLLAFLFTLKKDGN